MRLFDNARHALIAAQNDAPSVVAYIQGKGWTVYSPTQAAPQGATPEILTVALGHLPLPLCASGGEVLISIYRNL